MNPAVAKGRCPFCSTRLTLVQLVLTPKSRVFDCRNCKEKLQKVSNRMGPTLAWVAAISLTTSRFGVLSIETALVVGAALLYLYVDALLFAKVKRADPEAVAEAARVGAVSNGSPE